MPFLNCLRTIATNLGLFCLEAPEKPRRESADEAGRRNFNAIRQQIDQRRAEQLAEMREQISRAPW